MSLEPSSSPRTQGTTTRPPGLSDFKAFWDLWSSGGFAKASKFLLQSKLYPQELKEFQQKLVGESDKLEDTLGHTITFLKSCETDYSVPEDSIESLQVATQCLSDAFGVDPDSPVDVAKYDLGAGKGLMDVWGVVRGVAKRVGDEDKGSKKDAAPSTAAAADDTKEAPAAASDKKEPNVSDKSQAEALKAEGNALITRRLYLSAIEKYSAAIALDPGNAVYYSNRAAAWGAMGEHAEAVKDAEEAVKRDPGFGRGWSRLGRVSERCPSEARRERGRAFVGYENGGVWGASTVRVNVWLPGRGNTKDEGRTRKWLALCGV
ncbi:hypothetical protein QFC20_002297 [Naganishia adeliensis]|uniref:Uncharacterized protein n=1 Tax=Naganishia adeliensis TaxID=92952 RepID=A0ACC2WKF7_9TREE|nr:hypothetical protein QFC20_002297 [Naganishia adeliensis]